MASNPYPPNTPPWAQWNQQVYGTVYGPPSTPDLVELEYTRAATAGDPEAFETALTQLEAIDQGTVATPGMAAGDVPEINVGVQPPPLTIGDAIVSQNRWVTSPGLDPPPVPVGAPLTKPIGAEEDGLLVEADPGLFDPGGFLYDADVAASEFLGGAPGETLSATAGRAESGPWAWFGGALDYVDPGHTERAVSNVQGNWLPRVPDQYASRLAREVRRHRICCRMGWRK